MNIVLLLLIAAVAFMVLKPKPWVDSGVRGDLDGDGIVTKKDLNIFRLYMFKPVDYNDPINVKADLNGDGAVDFYDLSEMARLVTD